MNSLGFDNDGVAKIKVVGVGGGGCNAVSRMFRERIQGVEYVAVNTDAQALMRSEVPLRIRMGEKLTRGLGVGGDPDKGKESADESREELLEAMAGSDMVFVAAGMGGGTGTGAAPVVAEIAREVDALTIGVVTKPFGFEGSKRRKLAEEGIARLKDKVDTLIIIPNDRLFAVCDEKVTMENAFKLADDVLRQGVQSIAELVTVPGEVNLDFADIRTVMSNAGPAWMAIGHGVGENKAVDAAREAVSSSLLDVSIDGAKGILFNITGGSDISLNEVQEAADVIRSAADPDAGIFFGMVTDLKMEDEVKITIIATGFSTEDAISLREDDHHISQLIMSVVGEETELDVPPFLRRQYAPRRRTGTY
ncbi:MAG: cell division protein FtsZ [Chloroflexota bacterium]|nr:cell division protein FtsZ [Chloroflexota bacterium]MDE2940879.1 cell division protein FtsZ [Chloroflexota bacterium]MDE3268420.1 cell division protein FtsZ [Chloroflexota bacterium]